MKANKIAIIGECMVELQKADDLYRQNFGGDTLNTALYLSRLTFDHNVETSYFTALGQDPFSKQMLQAWKEENINTDYVHISDTKLPGMYAIETTPDGERSFYYWRNDAAAKFWLRDYDLETLVERLSSHQLIYLSGISLAILPQDCLDKLFSALKQCKEKGSKVAFDNNYRPALWSSKDDAQKAYAHMLELTDIAFLTFDDEMMLYGDTHEEEAIARTKKYGVEHIVIKRGAEPCFVITGDEQITVSANKIDNVLDTTAAGDSFSAGYLARLVLDATPEQCAHMGHQLAGTVIQHPGAIIPNSAMPTL